jgi:hypothetical protein
MATFTQTNGTTQPVFATDVRNGSIAGTANIAAQGSAQVAGPKLDFFSLVANASLITGGNVNGYLQNTFQQIQSGGGIADGGAGGTVAMYQVSPASPTILNIAIYPTGAYTSAQLLACAQQANASGGLTTTGWASCAGNAVFTTMNYATGLPIAAA